MNWRWKHIIVCAIIGSVFGALAIYKEGQLIGLSFPLVVNLLYWGFRKARVILGIAKKVAKRSAPIDYNVTQVMGEPGLVKVTAKRGSPLFWIGFYLFAVFLAYFVGFYAFPKAMYEAIKNVE